VKEQMRILIHGIDSGKALLIALVLIFILSTAIITLIPRISAMRLYTQNYKTRVINDIEKSNMEIINKYDIR